MRPLHVRFRHAVACPFRECSKIVCAENDVTRAVHMDGSPVSLPAFDTLKPHLFELACPDGHTVTVHFPKDVMIVKSPDIEGGDSIAPAVLRP
jgi:hypothetical protein